MEVVSGVSKIFKNNNEYPLFILSCLEFNHIVTKEFITNYNDTLIKEYPILKKRMIKYDNEYVFENIESFDINNHVTITDELLDIKQLMNNPINIFHIYWYIDNDISKFVFVIDHAYCDGYKLIEMLTTPLQKIELPNFKRNINIFNKLYHIVVGTIILLIMNIKILCKIIKNIFIKKFNHNKNTDTDFIQCKCLNLSTIKNFTKLKGITVNDFLFSLMIKTDKLYTGVNRNITVSLPINTTQLDSYNNFMPICETINNSFDNESLLGYVHSMFNHYKYSLFIPIVQYIINYIINNVNINLVTLIYDLYADHCDYIFTNMIGPNLNELNINNLSFFVKHKSNAITYNIISYNDDINLICSFKKNLIKNKELYEECIYKAYDNLLNLDSGFFK